MTMRGVYQKWIGTPPPSPEASATVEALRAICELDLSKLDGVELPNSFGATEITQTTPRWLRVFCGCTERSVFRSRGCPEYNLHSFFRRRALILRNTLVRHS